MVDLPPPALSLHFPLRPPGTRARRRALRLGIGQGLYIAFVVALLFAVNSLDVLVGPGALRIWLISLGLGAFFGYLAFQASRSPAHPAILLGDRGLSLPLRGHERQAFVDYDRLGVAYTNASELVLGIRGYFPERFRRDDFQDPGAAEQIVGIIRQQVATPTAVEPFGIGARTVGRLASLDRRATIDQLLHHGRAPLSWGFAVLLTLLFGLQLYAAGGFDGFNSITLLVLMGANVPALVWQEGEVYRLVTSSLLHGGFGHFALNTVGLIVIGRFVEPLLGRWRYLCLLLLSCLGGAIASALPLRPDAAVSLGASTGLAGTFAAYALLRQRFRADLPMPAPSRAFWIILALLVLAPALIVPNIDHLGHAGGAATGVALAALFSRGVPLDQLARRPAGLWRPLGVLLALLFLITPAWTLWRQAPILGEVTGSELTNEEAWIIGIYPGAPRESLEAARDAMEAVVADEPLTHYLDTLATLYHRLGEHGRAVETQRHALAQDDEPDPFLYGQLTRFELARVRALGAPSIEALGLQLHLKLGKIELSSVDPSRAVEHPAQLHAVLQRGDLPILHLTIDVPASASLPAVYELPANVRRANSGALQLTVTLAERRTSTANEVDWRVIAVDPEAFQLPGPLP